MIFDREWLNVRLGIALLMTCLAVAAFLYAVADFQTVSTACTTFGSMKSVEECSLSQKYFLGAVIGGIFATLIALVGWAMYRADLC